MNPVADRKTAAVVLAGCGGWDGTQVHEATLAMLALDRAGVSIVCAAPDLDQLHVVNHLSHEELDRKRNALVESGRLAHGPVLALDALAPGDLDAVILPGGHGVIKQLSDFAVKGPACDVHPGLQHLLCAMHRHAKPIGAISIAPVIVVRSLDGIQASVTTGRDPGTAAAVGQMGGQHHGCDADHIHVDREHRIVTTPGCSTGAGLSTVSAGIEKMVQAVVSLMEER